MGSSHFSLKISYCFMGESPNWMSTYYVPRTVLKCTCINTSTLWGQFVIIIVPNHRHGNQWTNFHWILECQLIEFPKVLPLMDGRARIWTLICLMVDIMPNSIMTYSSADIKQYCLKHAMFWALRGSIVLCLSQITFPGSFFILLFTSQSLTDASHPGLSSLVQITHALVSDKNRICPSIILKNGFSNEYDYNTVWHKSFIPIYSFNTISHEFLKLVLLLNNHMWLRKFNDNITIKMYIWIYLSFTMLLDI